MSKNYNVFNTKFGQLPKQEIFFFAIIIFFRQLQDQITMTCHNPNHPIIDPTVGDSIRNIFFIDINLSSIDYLNRIMFRIS